MVSSSTLMLVAILPVVLICIFIYNKDKNKEPMSLLLKLFFLGIFSCFWVLVISEGLEKILPFLGKDSTQMSIFEIIIYTFISVALVEEFCKWIIVYFIGYKDKNFDQLYDIMVYSVFVSLGFAVFENVLYVFSNRDLFVGLLRAFLAIPGHACDAIFMGYYLSLAKLYSKKGKKQSATKSKILSILIPTLLHGIYDFCLFANFNYLIYFFFAFVIFLYSISLKKLKVIANNSVDLEPAGIICPNCGHEIINKVCPYCHSRINTSVNIEK